MQPIESKVDLSKKMGIITNVHKKSNTVMHNMGIISWIILGALTGWVASMIMGNNGSMGAISNIIVCIIDAFIGGFVMSQIGGYAVTG